MGKIGNKRKADVSDEQVINAYKREKSAYAVSKKLGIATTTIYRILERSGVKRDGLELYRDNASKFTSSKSASIRAEYEAGKSFADLIEKYGGTFHSIKSAIKRSGGKLIPVTPERTGDEVNKILEMHKMGISQMRISLAMGRSQSLVSRILKENGYIFSPFTGEKNSQWKGGRMMHPSGYVLVKHDGNNTFSSMCNNAGYIMEHRLVMARSIGRPLRKDETVHHINNDKLDNRLENLQLRQGKHGKHSVMVCLDCGSHNLGYAPIKDA